mgnify:CR=1 FL=1
MVEVLDIAISPSYPLPLAFCQSELTSKVERTVAIELGFYGNTKKIHLPEWV